MILDSYHVVEVDVTGAPRVPIREPWLRRLRRGHLCAAFTPGRVAVALHRNGQVRAVVHARARNRGAAMRATFDEATPSDLWPEWLRDVVHRVQVAYGHG